MPVGSEAAYAPATGGMFGTLATGGMFGSPGMPGAAPAAPAVASEILGGARLPRGAFLWPEATVAALGLRAQSPDGVAGMPVVALELLAAAAVADLGTWITAFPSADRERISAVLGAATPGGRSATLPLAASTGEIAAPTYATQVAGSLGAAGSAGSPTAALTAADGAELATGDAADILAPQLAAAPVDVRARFQAIYVALAQSGEGQMMSPSARAARAMSMLARTDAGAALTPRDRALTAWSAMPQIYQGDLDVVAPSAAAGAADGGDEMRPGLAGLAARAGESLASFVSPTQVELATAWGSDSPRSGSLASRTVDPVYVSTGSDSSSSSSSQDSSWVPLGPSVSSMRPNQAVARPGRAFAQTGGGEPEIPSWFEAAARLALEQRSPGSGLSIAELVLVNAASAPSRAIAASTRGSSTAAPQHTAGSGAQGNQEGEKPDVDKLAHEVYLEVLHLIDIARMRSGDPFQ